MAYTKLTQAIKAVSESPQAFCETFLNLKPSTFNHRVRMGKLWLEDYHKILLHTGKTFEELFPNPYQAQRTPQAQTIPKIVIPRHQVKSPAIPNLSPSRPNDVVDTTPISVDEFAKLIFETEKANADRSEIEEAVGMLSADLKPEVKQEPIKTPAPSSGFKARSINLLSVPEPKKDDDRLEWQAAQPPQS